MENGATYDVSVSGRVVARIAPVTTAGPQRWVAPGTAREIATRSPLTPAEAAAWKDIDEAFDDEMDDDPWASAEARRG